MGTKNNPGKFDCYANADPDEPMFVLLARDKYAPTLVWLWATLRELDGEDAEKVKEARDCCFAMMGWATDHDRPVAGLGHATLAGVIEMIRTVNHCVKEQDSLASKTPEEFFRRLMGESQFEKLDT